MRVAAASDWRDGLPFDTPVLVSEVLPGEATRCSVCGGDSELRPRTELWAVKHRHPRHHDGYVKFYCLEHRPVIERVAPAPERARAARRPTGPRSSPRRTAAVEQPRALCPDCFVEVPPTGVCGMCGRTVAS